MQQQIAPNPARRTWESITLFDVNDEDNDRNDPRMGGIHFGPSGEAFAVL